MTFIFKWLKQIKCRFIDRDCGTITIAERHEKPQRKLIFMCGKCDRILVKYV